jgi:hypothetical protein
LGNINIQTGVSVSNVRNPTFEEIKTTSNIRPYNETEVKDSILIKTGYNRIPIDKSDMGVLNTKTTVTEVPETIIRQS